MHILIGGYTKHESAGIYQFDFIGSGDQAHLEQRRNVVEVGGPTYFQKDGQFIFTIKNENGQGASRPLQTASWSASCCTRGLLRPTSASTRKRSCSTRPTTTLGSWPSSAMMTRGS